MQAGLARLRGDPAQPGREGRGRPDVDARLRCLRVGWLPETLACGLLRDAEHGCRLRRAESEQSRLCPSRAVRHGAYGRTYVLSSARLVRR